jgi:acetolactate synthase-1/2/3 large subunit
VVIDLPKNVQQAKAQPRLADARRDQERFARLSQPDLKADELALNEIIGFIEKAERPVLYCGGGIITSGAAAELKKFAEATNIPGHHDVHGHGRFPGNASALACAGWACTVRGLANWAVNGEYEQREDLQRSDGEVEERRGPVARVRRALR